MTTTQRKNLGKAASIECRTRIKLLKATREALTALGTIQTINARQPMKVIRAIHGEVNGTAMLEAASNLTGTAQTAKVQKYRMQCTAQLMRAIIQEEMEIAGTLGMVRSDLDDLGYFDFEDMEDGEDF
jgi:hypothetical protein